MMEINEGLLRKYIFHNQVLRDHDEAVAETGMIVERIKACKAFYQLKERLDKTPELNQPAVSSSQSKNI